MKQQACLLIVGCMSSGIAFADCSEKLDAETLIECITIEGSGADYNDWRKKFAQQALPDDAMPKSALTDKDIGAIAPAAGTPTN